MEFLSDGQSVTAFFKQNPLWVEPKWRSLFHAILNSGVRFTTSPKVKWLAGYSNVPLTVKSDPVKEHFYIMHDLFHQLFPVQCTGSYEEKDRVMFKRSSMAGEVAVLYLTEFMYARDLAAAKPEWAGRIHDRLSLPMMDNFEDHWKKDYRMMSILDNLIYEEVRYPYLRGYPSVEKWLAHYWHMLAMDRHFLDVNWEILKEHNWQPWRKHAYPSYHDHKALGQHFISFIPTSVPLNLKGRVDNMFLRLRTLPDFEGWAG